MKKPKKVVCRTLKSKWLNLRFWIMYVKHDDWHYSFEVKREETDKDLEREAFKAFESMSEKDKELFLSKLREQLDK